MRVVQVSFHVDPQGREPAALLEAWPTLPSVAAATARAGIDTAVVQAAAQDATLQRDGVSYHFVREPNAGRVRRRLGPWASPGGERVVRRVAELGADVVHAQSLGFPRQLRRLADRLAGRPILVQDHADRVPPRWAARTWRNALGRVAGVAFTAREQATPFVTAGALSNGVPVFEVLESSTTFTPGNRAAARRITGLYGEPCCVWLGRLDANKDPLTALAGFERAAGALPAARFWMFWTAATLEGAVRRRIASSEVLRTRVEMVGAVPHRDVEPILRAADFLIQASHREGSGYAVLEALACGATPIVTDIAPFRRITRHGEVGALFPPRAEEALAGAIVQLAAREPSTLRLAARRHFENHLCFAAVARELRAAYAAIVA